MVSVDANRCIGCGACVALCPDCFEMGKDGKSHVKAQSCKKCNLRDVAAACPVGAIKV
ncbi:MAG: ferredoxin [Candidatus Micrarchaeia archaeon]